MKIPYLAAMLDGEGSVSIVHQRSPRKLDPDHRVHVLYVNITNTNREVIETIHKFLKFGSIRSKPISSRLAHWKILYVWEARSLAAERFLKLVSPYLIIKRDHAKIALNFQSKLSPLRYQWNKSRTWQSLLCDRIRNLNYYKGAAKKLVQCKYLYSSRSDPTKKPGKKFTPWNKDKQTKFLPAPAYVTSLAKSVERTVR